MRKALGLAILSAGLALPVVVAQTENKSAQPAATIAPASPIARHLLRRDSGSRRRRSRRDAGDLTRDAGRGGRSLDGGGTPAGNGRPCCARREDGRAGGAASSTRHAGDSG